MSKFSMKEKTSRTTALLIGLRRKVVLDLLEEHGLTHADLDEGDRLIDQANLEQSNVPLRISGTESLVAELDAFETAWIAVAERKLKRRFPAVAQELVAHVDRSHARNALWNVRQFLERLGKMERGEAPFGVEGPPARQLLAELGLTAAEAARGQALVVRITQFEDEGPAPRPDTSARDAALAAMWAWCLEWSAVARRFIDDPVILRSLGLGRRTRKDDVDETPEQPLLPGLVNAPALVVAPAPAVAAVTELVKKAG